MMNKENIVWKTYPSIYFLQANQYGEVRTIDHYTACKDGRKCFYKGHVLKQYVNKKGYMMVYLSVNGKQINLRVHRIIATCFLPNPDNLPQVNHKDCDRTNNNVDNLEFCTNEYNIAYREKYGATLGRSVFAINLKTFEVSRFKSQRDASRQLGISQGNIWSVLEGRLNQTNGFWFSRADSNAIENTRLKFGDEVAGKVKALLDEKVEN